MEITYYWDPVSGSIRAIAFASDGSWSRAQVEVGDAGATLAWEGITPDGKPLRLTAVLERPDEDGVRVERWTDMVIDGRPVPGEPEIPWRRP